MSYIHLQIFNIMVIEGFPKAMSAENSTIYQKIQFVNGIILHSFADTW